MFICLKTVIQLTADKKQIRSTWVPLLQLISSAQNSYEVNFLYIPSSFSTRENSPQPPTHYSTTSSATQILTSRTQTRSRQSRQEFKFSEIPPLLQSHNHSRSLTLDCTHKLTVRKLIQLLPPEESTQFLKTNYMTVSTHTYTRI